MTDLVSREEAANDVGVLVGLLADGETKEDSVDVAYLLRLNRTVLALYDHQRADQLGVFFAMRECIDRLRDGWCGFEHEDDLWYWTRTTRTEPMTPEQQAVMARGA